MTFSDRAEFGNTITNPKKLLLSDPLEVRKEMRHFMQQIYNKQDNLTPEKEHVESFLRGNGDEDVWNELPKRRLTEEDKSWMEGPITKLEMRHQLFQHMKPNSAPAKMILQSAW